MLWVEMGGERGGGIVEGRLLTAVDGWRYDASS